MFLIIIIIRMSYLLQLPYIIYVIFSDKKFPPAFEIENWKKLIVTNENYSGFALIYLIFHLQIGWWTSLIWYYLWKRHNFSSMVYHLHIESYIFLEGLNRWCSIELNFTKFKKYIFYCLLFKNVYHHYSRENDLTSYKS